MRYLIGLLMLLVPLIAMNAEIYKWTDEQGKVHFSDSKPATRSVEQVELKINSYTHVTYESSPSTFAGAVSKGAKSVIMYSTEWCTYCKKARRFFKAKGIAFTEYDIEKSTAAKRAYDKLGGRGVPVILIDKSRMNGFSEQGFLKLYEG
ncbi:MAG: DUF4124 domain-containing protein [Sedimenticola sp.]|nr:DUF4124 domain-containing protein [Sedimenticola sp.]MCW8921883.1 DUF4124 domain-containing protein [Sedimenticola sp.]MCW8947419.1 DUF4124 domain-containing protein [Sedimenticola sp.]MCW8950585.1 DUF4124 domain-containing protein [Sedimenticola sp.]MCW8976818.1 DUF4124 domain-containing protein [Sedimenticola sp.]